MSEEERTARHNAQQLQAVIDSVARQSRDRPLDEIIELLQVSLTKAGLRSPSRPWLDAVAREAAAGRTYMVATDALLLGLDETSQSQALEHAPAELTTELFDPMEQDGPLQSGPLSLESDPRPDASSQAGQKKSTRTAVRRSDIWVLAGLVSLTLLLVVRRWRSSRTGDSVTSSTGE